MRIRALERNPDFDYRQFVKRTALASDYSELIREDTLFTVGGSPILLYARLDHDFERIREMLLALDFQNSTRTGGLKTTSRVFGYQPRIALRRDYCTATSLAFNEPKVNEAVCELGTSVDALYRKWFPAVHQQHGEALEKVLPEWRITGSVFTSGIINKNNPLKYHFDAGNFKNVCSCMIAIRRDVEGGCLSLPEFNIALEIADGSITMFDGQDILHGVTPFVRRSNDAHRFTMVYYALRDMWKCEPVSEELARIRNLKSKRERGRLQDSFVLDQNGTLHGDDEHS